MIINIEQLKAARDEFYGFDETFYGTQTFQLSAQAIETIRILLDNAINAPDLESLKREVYAQEFVKHCECDIDLVSCVIDHLAPRIVREGMVVVPEAPTEAMIEAGRIGYNHDSAYSVTFDEPYDCIKTAYKAMIAASNGGLK
jgi:hypothetical protein